MHMLKSFCPPFIPSRMKMFITRMEALYDQVPFSLPQALHLDYFQPGFIVFPPLKAVTFYYNDCPEHLNFWVRCQSYFDLETKWPLWVASDIFIKINWILMIKITYQSLCSVSPENTDPVIFRNFSIISAQKESLEMPSCLEDLHVMNLFRINKRKKLFCWLLGKKDSSH